MIGKTHKEHTIVIIVISTSSSKSQMMDQAAFSAYPTPNLLIDIVLPVVRCDISYKCSTVPDKSVLKFYCPYRCLSYLRCYTNC